MAGDPSTYEQQRRGARRTARIGLVVVVVMAGLSFAAVPLYDMICRVTGFAGATIRAESGADKTVNRPISVRFAASVHRDMPWSFEPEQSEMTVRLGENALAFYRAHNPTDMTVTGTASFNVAPYDVGGYFVKLECFCFTEQTLGPGETVSMPVSFYVDPELLEDEENKDLRTITLSYTFFVKETAEAGETATH